VGFDAPSININPEGADSAELHKDYSYNEGRIERTSYPPF